MKRRNSLEKWGLSNLRLSNLSINLGFLQADKGVQDQQDGVLLLDSLGEAQPVGGGVQPE